MRLDRDWYMGAEEGSLMGDEEHNPLAQYEDLMIVKQAEIAKRLPVRPMTIVGVHVWLTSPRKFLLNKHNTSVHLLFSPDQILNYFFHRMRTMISGKPIAWLPLVLHPAKASTWISRTNHNQLYM